MKWGSIPWSRPLFSGLAQAVQKRWPDIIMLDDEAAVHVPHKAALAALSGPWEKGVGLVL